MVQKLNALSSSKMVCSAARVSEEERSREHYTAFCIARESHPSRMAWFNLIGQKYELKTSAAHIIPAPDNKVEIISFCYNTFGEGMPSFILLSSG